MNRPRVRTSHIKKLKGLPAACKYCQASSPPINPEYNVIVPTTERVAMNHFESTSSASHSCLSFIMMSCDKDLRHMAKVLFILAPSILIIFIIHFNSYKFDKFCLIWFQSNFGDEKAKPLVFSVTV